MTNTPSSQERLLNGLECKFILRQVRPNLFYQVIRNLHKAVCGLQSLIFRRRHQKSLQLWWMMQTGILTFSSWKKPPITGEMCSCEWMNRKRRLGRSCYVGILLSKFRSVLLTFDVAVQADFNSGLACSQYFLFSVTIPGKTGEREETVMSAKTSGTVTRGREEIGQ